MKTKLIENREKKGIELYFEYYPFAASRNILKGAGFKWHNMKKCWYAVETPERREVAEKVLKRENGHKIPETVKAAEPAAEPEKIPEAVKLEEIRPELPEVVTEAEKLPEAGKDPDNISTLGNIPKREKAAKKSKVEKIFDKIAKQGEAAKCTRWTGSYNDITYCCDGFSLMVTTEPVKAAEPIEKSDADHAEKMKRDTKEASDKEYKLAFTAKELREGISTLKAGKRSTKVVYCFEDHGLTINAGFLLNAMEATGADTVHYNNVKCPIYMEGENTFFMVCPINNISLTKGLNIIQ